MTTVHGTDERGDPTEYPSVLAWLEDARVVGFQRDGDNLLVTEMCDLYFNATLSRAHVEQLINELQELMK